MDIEKQIREIIHQHCGGTYTNRDKATKEILSLFSVGVQSEQLQTIKELKDFTFGMNSKENEDKLWELIQRL